MSTPHNQAQPGEIAKVVLMPGDPLRAKFIAETFLEHPRLVNQVRGMYAYTGAYKGREVTVMASGMGMPSMGIYSYELFAVYGVEAIIRIGSSGAYVKDLNLYDVVLAKDVWSNTSFGKVQNGNPKEIRKASESLNAILEKTAERLEIPLTVTRVHSSDVFYQEANMGSYEQYYKEHGCTCVDMESFALFHNAEVFGKKAACMLTISDSFVTKEAAGAKERQNAFTNMMKIALEACLEVVS